MADMKGWPGADLRFVVVGWGVTICVTSALSTLGWHLPLWIDVWR